jgi:hypothetical protein
MWAYSKSRYRVVPTVPSQPGLLPNMKYVTVRQSSQELQTGIEIDCRQVPQLLPRSEVLSFPERIRPQDA